MWFAAGLGTQFDDLSHTTQITPSTTDWGSIRSLVLIIAGNRNCHIILN